MRQRSGGEDRWGQIEQMGIGWDAHLRSLQLALEGERRGDDCDGQYAYRLDPWPIFSLFISSTGEENSA